MKVNVLKEEKDFIELELAGETHTLVNFIRKELWSHKDTEIASYNIKHPQVSQPILAIKAKSKPKKVLQTTIEDAKKKVDDFRKKVQKLKV